MESEFSPDKQKETPVVPIKTYQWEDLRRARRSGGYPWTHLLKPPLEGELTAEDILRESTPKRSMSREFSKSRTHSPVDKDRDTQKILQLDSSPGSSRKHTEDGEDKGVHVPNFSKEISLDSEDDAIKKSVNTLVGSPLEGQVSSHLSAKIEIPKNASPKGILKRRVPEPQQVISPTETKEKTKCCHPLVNKIKHLADKTLQKLEKNENEKSPKSKRKKNEDDQEIRQLKSSPGSTRRQKFSAIKLGDSDEMSKTMSVESPPSRKKKEHIYEDIEESKAQDGEKTLQFSPLVDKYKIEKGEEESRSSSNKENESLLEKKSIASGDPSLVIEDNNSLKPEEHVMEKLHKVQDIDKEALLLDEEMDPEEPNVDEVFQNQFEENLPKTDSPNITITEISDSEAEVPGEQSTAVPIETSPSPSPSGFQEKPSAVEIVDSEWSKPSSDHEYEIIEKPPNIIYTNPSVHDKQSLKKTDDDLSSTTSLERKYLQHTSDEEEQFEDKDNINMDTSEGIMDAKTLQRDIEDRFFVNTPTSTVSRTECDVSTSQVDSSALENLPLKRGNRSKNQESIDNKIQQRIKEGTGKLKSQAGKLKTKLQNIKTTKFTMPERPKINFPDRTKFKMPDRPKISLPDRRKFSLPAKPKFQKINISEKLSFGDRKKFTLPDRPKFNVPDLSKFKMPEFPSLGRKKEYKVETVTTQSSTQDVATVDFTTKTYPRLFGRKKKTELPKTSSSPTLYREDTPPPTFTFTRINKTKVETKTIIPDSPEEPREYGSIDPHYEGVDDEQKQYEETYDFDNIHQEYQDDKTNFGSKCNGNSVTDISSSNHELTHINEINNDEFFVRPRGISRENIQVREYLSDEIRQAFKIPKNALALMGSGSGINDDHMYANEPDADPELMLDDNNHLLSYSSEDLNDKDDGYYTFPPVRPSRAKRKKKEEEPIKYIDDSVHASMQFSEVDLGAQDDYQINQTIDDGVGDDKLENPISFPSHTIDLHSIHEYANDDVIEYPENVAVQSQTLPMPPKRKRRFDKKDFRHSSLSDMKDVRDSMDAWDSQQDQIDDIIVYRTEHEYTVPQTEMTVTEQSPLPPRRNRSRSSRGTSLCDDDRTSHGAESLTLDTHMPQTEDIVSSRDLDREIRHESPGYATIDKGPSAPPKGIRRSKSKTPPVRRRKSYSSDRKYYTVGPTKPLPDRPPRKKSSTSLVTLNSLTKKSVSGDFTPYDEIEEPKIDEIHKDLQSGEVVSKMKDRPLPPPPRPPRGSKRPKKGKRGKRSFDSETKTSDETVISYQEYNHDQDVEKQSEDVVEIEVSTQTDPLPDDVDFELSMEENLDISMSSSLRDIVDEEPISHKSVSRLAESPRFSRPASRSEKSLKLSDPKISELSKSNIGRTSPTVILVERRVSSPTRINEREEMLTEASLSVQRIDVDESKIPDVPPLPSSRVLQSSSPYQPPVNTLQPVEERALERIADTSNRDIQVENLITQRLQVGNLDVGRLNVSELQASKILVSDIEGMTLQVTELDSKSGHISVSGIEFSQSVIDEIVKKFAEISTNVTQLVSPPVQIHESGTIDHFRPESREEQTQTDVPASETRSEPLITDEGSSHPQPPPVPMSPGATEDTASPPQRPPPPDLTPLLYSYLQDITATPSTLYHGLPRSFRERPFTEFHETQHQSPPPPARRAKRKPAANYSESSSDEDRIRPSPRRMPAPVRAHEPSITEAGAQFLRVCQNSISRTIRSIMNSFMSYISGTEDKKDVQMALVIFLVLIAGLIMFGLSDSRTIHHHHWEFFNPPDGKQ